MNDEAEVVEAQRDVAPVEAVVRAGSAAARPGGSGSPTGPDAPRAVAGADVAVGDDRVLGAGDPHRALPGADLGEALGVERDLRPRCASRGATRRPRGTTRASAGRARRPTRRRRTVRCSSSSGSTTSRRYGPTSWRIRSSPSASDVRTECWRSPTRTHMNASVVPRFGYCPRPVTRRKSPSVSAVEVAAVVEVAVAGGGVGERVAAPGAAGTRRRGSGHGGSPRRWSVAIGTER